MKELSPINNSYINKTMGYHNQMLSNSPLQQSTKNESCHIKQSKEEARQRFFAYMSQISSTQVASPFTTKFGNNAFNQPQTQLSGKMAAPLKDNTQSKSTSSRSKFTIADTVDRITQLQNRLKPSQNSNATPSNSQLLNASFKPSPIKLVEKGIESAALTHQPALQDTFISTRYIGTLKSSNPNKLTIQEEKAPIKKYKGDILFHNNLASVDDSYEKTFNTPLPTIPEKPYKELMAEELAPITSKLKIATAPESKKYYQLTFLDE